MNTNSITLFVLSSSSYFFGTHGLMFNSLRTAGLRNISTPAYKHSLRLFPRSPIVSLSPNFTSSRLTMFTNRNLVTISSSIVEGLKKHGVFPDVLDEFLPQGLLTISYGKDIDVVLGNTLKPKDTQSIPKVQFTLNVEAEKPDNEVHTFSANDYFTLVLTDPDAPSRNDNKWSEYAHFIKPNVKLLSSSDASKNDDFLSAEINLSDSDSFLGYQGPAPPPKTGKHRYVFILFRQKSGHFDPKPLKDRPNWGTGKPGSGVKDWANQYPLEPVAINFFYSQNDEQ